MQDVNGLRGKSASRKQDTLQTDPQKQPGFLPIETNWFDRFFISVVLWVALSLFWFRFFEPLGLSIWIANVISAVTAIFIIKKG